MITIAPKTKTVASFAVKLLIVMGAFYFIYTQLTSHKQLNWGKLWVLVQEKFTFVSLLGILFLSFLNRYFEILKWQNLVRSFRFITLLEASKQVLAALTAGLFTPNGIGEYAGKALFFEKAKRKKIVFLNLICNGIQMIFSGLFGLLGLLYLGFCKQVMLIFALLLGILILTFFLKKITIKGYSVAKLIHKTKEIPRAIHQKNILYGLGRYLVFSHQYYFLFLIFDVQLPYFTMMASISAIYLLASALPSFQFLDFAVKGSVAIYFFGLLNVNQWVVVFISTLMWLLNVVIPVMIGSYYVLNFKTK